MPAVFFSKSHEPRQPRKLSKLRIEEVSLVDKGANQHAFVTLYKRDTAATEIEVPQDSDPHFNASGRGPAHDRLMSLYDNYKRSMAYPNAAFRAAWDDLTDDEKQEIRDEEAATEAARQAAADAEQKERQAQMSEQQGLTKASITKRDHYLNLTKAAQAAFPELRANQALARFVETPKGGEMYRAYSKSAGEDYRPPAPAAPVVKICDARSAALDRLAERAAFLRSIDPNLTMDAAIHKVLDRNPDLARLSRGQA